MKNLLKASSLSTLALAMFCFTSCDKETHVATPEGIQSTRYSDAQATRHVQERSVIPDFAIYSYLNLEIKRQSDKELEKPVRYEEELVIKAEKQIKGGIQVIGVGTGWSKYHGDVNSRLTLTVSPDGQSARGTLEMIKEDGSTLKLFLSSDGPAQKTEAYDGPHMAFVMDVSVDPKNHTWLEEKAHAKAYLLNADHILDVGIDALKTLFVLEGITSFNLHRSTDPA